MNFDMKYTRNLRRMNFIKIKQGLGIILGAQNLGSKAKATYDPGCKLGAFNKRADNVGPTNQRERRKFRWIKSRERCMNLFFEL